jgi:hypothetical protein
MTIVDRRVIFKARTRGDRSSTVRWRGRVRPVRRAPSLDPNGSIHLRGSINSVWVAWGSLSWYFDISDILVRLSKHLSLISIIDSSHSEIESDSKCICLSDVHHHSEIGSDSKCICLSDYI